MKSVAKYPQNHNLKNNIEKSIAMATAVTKNLQKSIITTLVSFIYKDSTNLKVKNNNRKSVAMATTVGKCCLKPNHKFLL